MRSPAGSGVRRWVRISACWPIAAAIAARLLWAAMAASTEPSVTVDWLTADQQWAIDVCLAARLPLSAGPSRCWRGAAQPLTPYLPHGALG